MASPEDISKAVETGKSKIVVPIIEEALAGGIGAADILKIMIDAMGVVGDKFSRGEIFVPEMLVAAKAMQKGVVVLKPLLAGKEGVSLGKCIIGTVSGDLHDIGKNLVAMMIESSGFEVIDLGVDVSAEKFIETIKANPDVSVVALSALLTTTMPSMRNTAETIRSSGLTGFKLLVGGAPITQRFADEIGADAYAMDAAGAAVAAKELAG